MTLAPCCRRHRQQKQPYRYEVASSSRTICKEWAVNKPADPIQSVSQVNESMRRSVIASPAPMTKTRGSCPSCTSAIASLSASETHQPGTSREKSRILDRKRTNERCAMSLRWHQCTYSSPGNYRLAVQRMEPWHNDLSWRAGRSINQRVRSCSRHRHRAQGDAACSKEQDTRAERKTENAVGGLLRVKELAVRLSRSGSRVKPSIKV